MPYCVWKTLFICSYVQFLTRIFPPCSKMIAEIWEDSDLYVSFRNAPSALFRSLHFDQWVSVFICHLLCKNFLFRVVNVINVDLMISNWDSIKYYTYLAEQQKQILFQGPKSVQPQILDPNTMTFMSPLYQWTCPAENHYCSSQLQI